MKKAKKIVSIMLSVLMLISVLTVVPITARAESSGDWEYEVLEDGTAEITYYNGSAAELNIPSELDGYTVTSIGYGAFDYNEDIVSVNIPDSVTWISAQAFSGCTSLTSINVSDDNKNYSSLDGNLYNKYKTELLTYAIGKEDKSFTIPDSVTKIGQYSFYCINLTSVNIPDSVESIGYKAFMSCTGLTSLNIPGSVKLIEEGAFAGCTSLKSINVSDSNANYSSLDGNLYNKDKTELINYAIGKEDTSFTIPDSVTYIGYCAFHNCASLTSINISDSVTEIYYMAFAYCSNLTSVNIGNSVKEIGYYAFEWCESLESVTIPDSVEIIDYEAFTSCRNLKIVEIENGVKEIGYRAFECCYSLESINIPDSVTSIGDGAFSYCDNLKSVIIPKSVTSIGDMAFGYFYDPYKAEDVKVENFKISGYSGSEAEKYADKNGFIFVDIASGETEPASNVTDPITTDPVVTEPVTIPENTDPVVTTPDVTQPVVTEPVATTPSVTEPTQPAPSKPSVTAKKDNPVKVTAKTKTVKAKKLKKKKQTVKPLTIKNAQGAVTVTKIKKGTTAKIFKKITVNKKTGAITFKKGKYAKKTYKIKLKIVVKGTSSFNGKTITKVVKVKIK